MVGIVVLSSIFCWWRNKRHWLLVAAGYGGEEGRSDDDGCIAEKGGGWFGVTDHGWLEFMEAAIGGAPNLGGGQKWL